MKKKHLIIIIVILIIITIILGIIKFITDFKEDANKSQELINKIKTNYTTLESNINKYNSTRDSIEKELTTYYQETFKEDYSKAITNMNEYDQIIGNIKSNIEKINKDCQNNIFADSDTNSICQTYKETYEKIVNTYINDINSFNTIIENYNQTNKTPLNKFTSSYVNDYIDYNNDGEYIGKEQS